MASKQAMEGRRINAFAMDPTHESLVIVGIDTKDGPEHPLYNKERNDLPLDEGMVLNMMEFGVLEPILVRKNGDMFEVEVGRQRLKHVREANRRLMQLPAEHYLSKKWGGNPIEITVMAPRRDDDVDAIGVMASENSLRRGDTIIGQAAMAKKLIDRGKDIAHLMNVFGKSRAHVTNLLALHELDDRVKKLIVTDKLAYTTALELKELPREEQAEKAIELAEKGGGIDEARRQKIERRRSKGENGNGHPETRGARVAVKTLRKLSEDEDMKAHLRDASAYDLLLWILGEEGRSKRIKGLSKFLGVE